MITVSGAPSGITGPCQPWCTVPDPEVPAGTDVAWCCGDLVDLADPTVRDKAVWMGQVATNVLWALTGYQHSGLCSADEFLCVRRDRCGCPTFGRWPSIPHPSGDASTWTNVHCGCGPGCDCAARRRVRLPYLPVSAVSSVTVDGVALVEDVDWELVDHRYLYLCSGDAEACFDPCTDPQRGLRVAWSHGVKPPPELETAACVLTCELTKACLNQPCQLPKRVTQVARQGVTWTVIDPQDFLERGRTGIYEVDLAVGVHAGPQTTVVFPDDVPPIDWGDRAAARW